MSTDLKDSPQVELKPISVQYWYAAMTAREHQELIELDTSDREDSAYDDLIKSYDIVNEFNLDIFEILVRMEHSVHKLRKGVRHTWKVIFDDYGDEEYVGQLPDQNKLHDFIYDKLKGIVEEAVKEEDRGHRAQVTLVSYYFYSHKKEEHVNTTPDMTDEEIIDKVKSFVIPKGSGHKDRYVAFRIEEREL